MKEGKFPNSRKPSHQQVCGEFWNLRGQHNWEGKKKKKKTHNMHLSATPNGEVAQTLAICHQPAGAGQGGVGCMLRVRTG